MSNFEESRLQSAREVEPMEVNESVILREQISEMRIDELTYPMDAYENND
jgi:hypothetical protein